MLGVDSGAAMGGGRPGPALCAVLSAGGWGLSVAWSLGLGFRVKGPPAPGPCPVSERQGARPRWAAKPAASSTSCQASSPRALRQGRSASQPACRAGVPDEHLYGVEQAVLQADAWATANLAPRDPMEWESQDHVAPLPDPYRLPERLVLSFVPVHASPGSCCLSSQLGVVRGGDPQAPVQLPGASLGSGAGLLPAVPGA